MITSNPFGYLIRAHQFITPKFWGAVIGGIMGYAGSRRSSKMAGQSLEETRRHNREMEAMAKKRQAIADRQQAIADERYQYWQDTYKPIETDLASAAQKGYDPRLGEVTADVALAFDKAGSIQRRNMERYGVDPNSGRFAGVTRNLALKRALAESGGRTQERRRAEDITYQRRRDAANFGRGARSEAMSGYTQAGAGYGGVASQHGSLANQSTQMANQYGNMAANTMASGINIGSRFDDYVQNQNWNKAMQTKYGGPSSTPYTYGNAFTDVRKGFNSALPSYLGGQGGWFGNK